VSCDYGFAWISVVNSLHGGSRKINPRLPSIPRIVGKWCAVVIPKSVVVGNSSEYSNHRSIPFSPVSFFNVVKILPVSVFHRESWNNESRRIELREHFLCWPLRISRVGVNSESLFPENEMLMMLKVDRWPFADVPYLEVKLDRVSFDRWTGIWLAAKYCNERSLIHLKLPNRHIQRISGKSSLPTHKIRSINLVLPNIPSEECISCPCEDSDYVKCAFGVSPYSFLLAAIGFCLYLYGFISAKARNGNACLSFFCFLSGRAI